MAIEIFTYKLVFFTSISNCLFTNDVFEEKDVKILSKNDIVDEIETNENIESKEQVVNEYKNIAKKEKSKPIELDSNRCKKYETYKEDSCYVRIDNVGLHSKFYVGDHSQKSVDTYDIVFTKDIYDYDSTIRFLGHNTRSFSILHKVSIGDTVYISDELGNTYKYRVVKSEEGYLSDDNFDIFSSSTNERLTNIGYVEFVTCFDGKNGNSNRWVVLCEKI